MAQHKQRGQSLIEVVTGCLVMVPIALLVVDVVFVLGIWRTNSDLSLAAARMASNQLDEYSATLTVRQTLYQFVKPAHVLSVSLSDFKYDTVMRLVTVSTAMEVQLPVPLPGCQTTMLTASSVQPIVGIPAAR